MKQINRHSETDGKPTNMLTYVKCKTNSRGESENYRKNMKK